jgi:hypothetical protein
MRRGPTEMGAAAAGHPIPGGSGFPLERLIRTFAPRAQGPQTVAVASGSAESSLPQPQSVLATGGSDRTGLAQVLSPVACWA